MTTIYSDNRRHNLGKTFLLSVVFHLLLCLIAGILLTEEQKEGQKGTNKIFVNVQSLPLKGDKKPDDSKEEVQEIFDKEAKIAEERDVKEEILSKEQMSADTTGKMGEKIVSRTTPTLKPLSYIEKVRRQIKALWVYPDAEDAQKFKGVITVQFYIYQSGSLGNVRMRSASGIPVLDQSVIKAVKEAAPFDELPAHINEKFIPFTLSTEPYTRDLILLAPFPSN